MYIFVIIVSIMIYIVEANHDHTLQKLFNSKGELEYVKKWHKLDFIFHILSVGLLSYVFYGVSWSALLLLINIGFLRQLVLNSTLNILNKKKLYYLGQTSKIDKILKPFEIYVFIFLILINITLIIYAIKWEIM